MSENLLEMARAAQHDDRLADGALYGKLADEICALRVLVQRWRSLATSLAKLHEPYVPMMPSDAVRRRTASGSVLEEIYNLDRACINAAPPSGGATT